MEKKKKVLLKCIYKAHDLHPVFSLIATQCALQLFGSTIVNVELIKVADTRRGQTDVIRVIKAPL